MNPTLARALILAVPIAVLIAGTSFALVRARTVYTVCWFAGAASLGVVVLTHVAEGVRWLPAMRWGQPDGAGHYLDLASASFGVTLLVVGTVVRILHRGENQA